MADLPCPRAPRGSSAARSSWLLVIPAVLTALLAGCSEEGAREATEPGGAEPADAGSGLERASAAAVVGALRDVRLAAASRPESLRDRPGVEHADAPRELLAEAEVERFDRDGDRLRPTLKGDALRGVAKPARVALPARATGAFEVSDETSGITMRVGLEGADDVAAEVVDGYVVYRGAIGGADVVHRVTGIGTEDYVALDEAPLEPAVTYTIELGERVAGLRLVSNTLELLDAGGAPRLRVAPPYVVDDDGVVHPATIAVEGCAVDTSAAGPWGRAVTPPGAVRCEVRVAWDDDGLAYPAVLDPSWTTTGGMATARTEGHTLDLLSDGRVLVVGGLTNAFPLQTPSAELYDPATGVWSSTGSMATGRVHHASSTIASGDLLITGGYDGGAGAMTAESYDVATGGWTARASMSAVRYWHTSTALEDGRVLVAGGNGSIGTAEIYDAATNTWSEPASLGAERNQHRATRLTDGRVLVTGGVASLWNSALFDPATDTWAPTGDFATYRVGHTVTALPDGRALVVGGRTNAYVASAEIYDPASGWSSAGSNTLGRQEHSATALADGRVLVTGGYTSAGQTATAELYDPATGWSPTLAMASARVYHRSVRLADGRVLVAGGRDASATTAELFEVADPLGAACSDDTTCTSGFCVDGVCCDAACGGGDANDCQACSVAAGAVADGTCNAVSAAAAIECRGSAGACDAAETCDGTSTECPADAAVTEGTACGGAPSGACDAQDTCVGTVGATATCQANFEPATITCRGAASECDAAETCTGSSAECPADGAVAVGTACGGAPSGDCDAQDTCVGTVGASATCQASFDPPTQTCRAAVSECDAAESCTGASADCPADAAVTVGTACGGAPSGACDAQDTCVGTVGASATCQVNFDPPTQTCRAAVSNCDVAETCTGAATTCPADAARPEGSACGNAPSGLCDLQDTCTGTVGASSTCVSNVQPANTGCRPSTGSCDPGESCNGVNPSCPPNAFTPQGTPCADGDACTDGDVCASGACVPGEELDCTSDDPCLIGSCDPDEGCVFDPVEDGTACSDGDACTLADTCQAGACTAGAAAVCDDGEACTGDACDPAVGCVFAAVDDGLACDDGNACTEGDVCADGACVPTIGDACDDGGACQVGSCNELLECDYTDLDDGTPCNDDDLCTVEDSCASGECAPGAPLDCDDLEPCTADSCDPEVGCVRDPVADGTPCGDDLVCARGVCVEDTTGEGGGGGAGGAGGGGGEGGAGDGGAGDGGATGSGGDGGATGAGGEGGATGSGGDTGSSQGGGSPTSTGSGDGGASSTTATGLTGVGGSGGAASGDDVTADGGGCDCNVRGTSSGGPSSLVIAGLVAALVRRRRRAA